MTHVVRYLVLWLTTGCNLHCCYCYGAEQNSAQVMPVKVAAEALALAAASGEPFHVQLAGGEPTLATGMIRMIAEKTRDHGWPSTIGLQTNGTLMDSRLLDLIQCFDIQVGVSLDGPPEVQERLRGGSQETVRGLRLLADHGIDFRVTAVVTDKNVNYLGALALMLSGFPNARGIGLDLLVTKGRASQNGVSHPSAEALKSGLQQLLSTLKAVNARRKSPIQLRELDRLRRAVLVHKPVVYCHACRGESIAVLPDGSIYPCSQTAGDPEFASGTVGAPRWDLVNRLANYRLEGAQCQSCVVKSSCPGDCPSRQFYNDSRSKALTCVMYQTLWSHTDLDCAKPFQEDLS